MVEFNKDQQLSETLKALSDPTRRALLTQLCQHSPMRVTDLANTYDMSLNAISKHIKVLEKVALVARKNEGREHWIEADLSKTAELEDWLRSLKSIWTLRLQKLETILNGESND